MAPRPSIFDFDVSVSADKARRQRRRGMSGAFESSARRCQHPGCDAAGVYRAPRSPQHLDEYRWFCLDHVREFNKSWNYFEDWSEEDIEAQIRNDGVWDRPTWSWKDVPKQPMGQHPHAEGNAWARFGFDDPLVVQAAHFGAVIRGEETPVVSGADGLAALRVIEAVKDAARTGQIIRINNTEAP